MHVAIGGGAALYARSLPALSPSEGPVALNEYDIDLAPVGVEPPRHEESKVEPSPASEPRVAMRVPNRLPSSPGGDGRTHGEEGDGEGAVVDSASTEAGGVPTGSGAGGAGPGGGPGKGDGPGRGPINIGVDRKMTWVWTNPDRPAPKPRPASTSGGLHEALDAHDRTLGLGYGGPVVSAFHSAAYHATAPHNGNARFEAIIDASGRVQSVQVLSVNGDRALWEAVANRVLALLRSKLLRVPPSGGVAVVVDVRSRYQLPSGSKPGEAVQMQGAGAQFDVSDIGARPAHNVAVHVVLERRL